MYGLNIIVLQFISEDGLDYQELEFFKSNIQYEKPVSQFSINNSGHRFISGGDEKNSDNLRSNPTIPFMNSVTHESQQSVLSSLFLSHLLCILLAAFLNTSILTDVDISLYKVIRL